MIRTNHTVFDRGAEGLANEGERLCNTLCRFRFMALKAIVLAATASSRQITAAIRFWEELVFLLKKWEWLCSVMFSDGYMTLNKAGSKILLSGMFAYVGFVREMPGNPHNIDRPNSFAYGSADVHPLFGERHVQGGLTFDPVACVVIGLLPSRVCRSDQSQCFTRAFCCLCWLTDCWTLGL